MRDVTLLMVRNMLTLPTISYLLHQREMVAKQFVGSSPTATIDLSPATLRRVQ